MNIKLNLLLCKNHEITDLIRKGFKRRLLNTARPRFKSAQMVNPRGSLSGQRVVYNMKTGDVTSGGQGNGRVKMRILPRNAPTGGG